MFLNDYIRESLKIPTNFPKEIQLFNDDSAKTDFSWIINSHRGTLVLFYGDFCSTCNTKVVDDIFNYNYDINVILFNVTYSNSRFEPTEITRELAFGCHVYSINIESLMNSLGILFVPFALAISPDGEISTGNVAETSEQIMDTLKRII